MARSERHDRRKETRLLCADLVTIRWQDAASQPQTETANLEDISEHGVCLLAELEIPPGTSVEILAGKSVIKGEVRYCRQDQLGSFIGVQMEEGSQWRKQFYRPKHLLDPRALVADKILRSVK